jgi:hypothetical protein
VTVGLGRNVLGLTLLGLVTSHRAVLSSIRPYLRACKLLRKLSFPWWRRFESPRMCVVYVYERGKTFSLDMKGVGVQRSGSFHLKDRMPIVMP